MLTGTPVSYFASCCLPPHASGECPLHLLHLMSDLREIVAVLTSLR
jgi:hypothetical protein